MDTANDAYALLLIATSEGFIRAYLISLGVIPLDDQSGMASLIDRSFKEFNRNIPKSLRRKNEDAPMKDLCKQRNTYAHGNGPNAFSSIGHIVTTLGEFFAHLP